MISSCLADVVGWKDFSLEFFMMMVQEGEGLIDDDPWWEVCWCIAEKIDDS
jgi:hypothetical protein